MRQLSSIPRPTLVALLVSSISKFGLFWRAEMRRGWRRGKRILGNLRRILSWSCNGTGIPPHSSSSIADQPGLICNIQRNLPLFETHMHMVHCVSLFTSFLFGVWNRRTSWNSSLSHNRHIFASSCSLQVGKAELAWQLAKQKLQSNAMETKCCVNTLVYVSCTYKIIRIPTYSTCTQNQIQPNNIIDMIYKINVWTMHDASLTIFASMDCLGPVQSMNFFIKVNLEAIARQIYSDHPRATGRTRDRKWWKIVWATTSTF